MQTALGNSRKRSPVAGWVNPALTLTLGTTLVVLPAIGHAVPTGGGGHGGGRAKASVRVKLSAAELTRLRRQLGQHSHLLQKEQQKLSAAERGGNKKEISDAKKNVSSRKKNVTELTKQITAAENCGLGNNRQSIFRTRKVRWESQGTPSAGPRMEENEVGDAF